LPDTEFGGQLPSRDLLDAGPTRTRSTGTWVLDGGRRADGVGDVLERTDVARVHDGAPAAVPDRPPRGVRDGGGPEQCLVRPVENDVDPGGIGSRVDDAVAHRG
jgi:hypothetical protein